MINIITWYVIGVLISIIGIFAHEYFYFYDRQIKYISKKEVIEDVLLSLLSWLMVLWLIISICLDCYMGWPSKGYELNKHKKSQS